MGENIVNIYDVVDEGRYHFIVMELVDGITLKEYIRIKGKLDITEGVSIAIQVARALKTAHAQHIVHRDIKPQNILITDDSKVKVADFGIARAVSEQTVNANAIGSVHYISPEQARGGRCDARSDIYSLGITMYEMFTGRVPFTGESTVAVALAHLEQAMTPPSVYNNKISPNLERIILKCTKKDPANRYQNITELLDDLENVLLNPDTPYEISGSTKIIKAEDTAMLSRVEPIDDMSDDEYERGDKEEEDDDDEYDEEDEKMDKIMSVAGVVIAVIIVVLLVFFVGRFTGVFGGKGSDTSQSKLDSTQTKMPDVVGLSEKMADKKLSDNNLQMQVKSSEYSDTVEKGNVISQEPKADEVVSKYSKVSVVISLGSDAFDISKLNLVGKTKESAESLLKENGFSTDTKEEPSDTVPKGSVISYTPTKPKNGERVTLTVSSGKKVTKVVVPNITGMSESEAKTLLETNGLILGKKAEQHSATVAKGVIIGQSTAAGSSVDSGSSVDYAVSNGVAPETTQASSEQQSSQSTNEQQTQPTKATVAPASAAANYRYVGSIDTNYSLQDVIGPSSGLTSVKVMIRLKQTVNGSDVYSTLMDARTVTGDTILPVRFRTIVGANGVDQGQVEIVNVDSGEVLKSYTVEFFRVE